jgi:hypothetical protein
MDAVLLSAAAAREAVSGCRPFTIPQKIKSLRRQAGCIPGVEAVTIIVKTLTKIGLAQ